MEYLVVFLVLGAIAFGIFRSRFDYEIHFSRGEISFRGQIPLSRHTEIKEFLQQQFPDRKKISIYGRKGPGGQLALKIRGADSPGERQQIRNYLLTVL